jgi:hypothetical protein
MNANHLVIVTKNLTGIPGEGEGEFYLDGVRLALTAISFEIRAGEMVKAKMELDCRVSTREPGGPPIYAVPAPPAGTDYREAMEIAWGIIANAHGGDWEKATPEWKAAAERWRDLYMMGSSPKKEEPKTLTVEVVHPDVKPEEREKSYTLFYWVAHPKSVGKSVGLAFDCEKISENVYQYRGRKLVTDDRQPEGEARLCRGLAIPGNDFQREFCEFYWVMSKAELDRLTDEGETKAMAGPDGRHRWHWAGHPTAVDERITGCQKIKCIWPPPEDPCGLHAFLFPEEVK